jgi:hypothetical protein
MRLWNGDGRKCGRMLWRGKRRGRGGRGGRLRVAANAKNVEPTKGNIVKVRNILASININASILANISVNIKDRVELATDAKYLNNIYFSRY